MTSAWSDALAILRTIWTENSGLDRLSYLFRGVYWQIRKRAGITFVTTLPNGARAKIYPASPFSGVFYCKWLEAKDMLFIRAHSHLAPTFVDVGANVGLFSALLFDKFERFYLFEPAPLSFGALRETCALNPSVHCAAMNIAVADKRGDVTFLDEGGFSSTSRVVRAAEQGSCTVAAGTLDNLLSRHVGDMVLKVDVEGFEERVFRGAISLVRAKRIKLVLFERLGRTNIDNLFELSAFQGDYYWRSNSRR